VSVCGGGGAVVVDVSVCGGGGGTGCGCGAGSLARGGGGSVRGGGAAGRGICGIGIALTGPVAGSVPAIVPGGSVPVVSTFGASVKLLVVSAFVFVSGGVFTRREEQFLQSLPNPRLERRR